MNQYEDISHINKRYILEERFIKAIHFGETQKACKLLEEYIETGMGLNFISDNQQVLIINAAILGTLAKTGARMAGLTPVQIDSINRKYAKKVLQAASMNELKHLIRNMVIQFCQEILKENERDYSAYVKIAIDYMNLNLGRQITIADISKAAGMNQKYFAKLFVRETGMSIKQYLAKLRCNIAEELLQDSKLSIQEISTYVGYLDNNYFSKIFKNHKGVTPQKYRKNYWSSMQI